MYSEVCENGIPNAWSLITIKREIHDHHCNSPWSTRTWSAISGTSFLRKYRRCFERTRSMGETKMSCILCTVKVLLPSLLTASLITASLLIRFYLWYSPVCLFLSYNLFLYHMLTSHHYLSSLLFKFSSFIICTHEKECKKNKLLWERMRTLLFSASQASWET